MVTGCGTRSRCSGRFQQPKCKKSLLKFSQLGDHRVASPPSSLHKFQQPETEKFHGEQKLNQGPGGLRKPHRPERANERSLMPSQESRLPSADWSTGTGSAPQAAWKSNFSILPVSRGQVALGATRVQAPLYRSPCITDVFFITTSVCVCVIITGVFVKCSVIVNQGVTASAIVIICAIMVT